MQLLNVIEHNDMEKCVQHCLNNKRTLWNYNNIVIFMYRKKWNEIHTMLKLLALGGGITDKIQFSYCFSVFAKFSIMKIC